MARGIRGPNEMKVTIESLMIRDYIAVGEHETVASTVEILRRRRGEFQNKFAYIYVINKEGELSGVLGTRDLLAEDLSRPIFQMVKREVLKVSASAGLEEALEIFSKYSFLAVPVTDRDRRLIGIIPAKGVEKYLKPAKQIDEEIERKHVKEIVVKRIPWVVISVTSSLMGAYILGIFIGKIESVIALILFVPVVLGLAGGVGTQFARITIREIRKEHVKPVLFVKLLFKEVAVSLMIAIFALLISAALAVLWRKVPAEGIALALSIVAAMTVSGILGIVAPVVLRFLRIDSDFVSELFTLLICDIVALTLYFLISLPIVNPMIELG